MGAKVEVETSSSSSAEAIKWILAAVFIAVAVIGNAYYEEQHFFYRLVGVLVLSVVAALVASQTQKGKAFLALLQDARSEIKRVVWPTKQETTQTTLIVVVVVFIMAFLLWLLDLGLGALITYIIG